MSTQSLRRAFSNDLAKIVLDEILFGKSRYYYFLGGIQPWNGFNGVSVDDLPPTQAIAQTEALDRLYRSEIAYVRKISPNDASLVVKRYDWVTGTVYTQWDHTLDMANLNFYVVTDEYNVYKCLNNNGSGPSTVKPTGRSIDPLRTSDGYIWKYMYNIPAFKRARFTSATYIPVQKALTDSFYNKGSVDVVVVDEEGAGYTYAPVVTINVASNTTTGSGATATVVIDSGASGGVGTITSVVITNGGSGYTKGVRVKFTSDTGREAVGTAVVSSTGVITGVTIAPGQGGVGYLPTNTNITFEVGGAVLVPVISQNTGSIVDVKIVDPGIGYLTAPVLTVVDSSNTGYGKYALPAGSGTALFTCIVFNGSIDQVNTIDPGIAYLPDTSTSISVQGDGTGAEFTPIVYGGRIIDVLVESPGEGYTELYLTVNGVHTTKAKLTAVVKQSDFQSDQTIIEQTTVDGAIYSVKITNPGAGYDPLTTLVTITGNGTGALATPVVLNGSIDHIHVYSPGSGYTTAQVNIIDTRDAVIDTKASAYAILPPVGGHGSDATSELLSNTLTISTPLSEELSVERVVQEFRTFGIIKNPDNLLTGTRYKDRTGLLVFKMRFVTSTSTLSNDEILRYGNNKYRVLDYDGQEVFLLPLDNDNVAPLGLLVSKPEDNNRPVGTPDVSYTSVQTLQPLNFDKYSGSLLYISSERPFSFSQEQSIVIKTFIKF